MFAQHNGRETTIDILGPVTTFILAAVIRDEPYLKSARTLTDARILMIPAEAVRDIFGRDAAFARAVVNELATRYRSIVRALKNEKQRTSSERLANWILKSDAQQGGTGSVTAQLRQAHACLVARNDAGEFIPELLEPLKTRNPQRQSRRGHRRSFGACKYSRPTPLIDG